MGTSEGHYTGPVRTSSSLSFGRRMRGVMATAAPEGTRKRGVFSYATRVIVLFVKMPSTSPAASRTGPPLAPLCSTLSMWKKSPS